MILKRSITFLFVIIIVVSCNEHSMVARITLDFPEVDSLVVKVFHCPSLGEEVLARCVLDSGGHGTIQLELSKPLASTIRINGYLYNIYLKPGYDLKLSRDTSNQSILFDGQGSQMNSYIQRLTILSKPENLIGYDAKTFANKFDSVRSLVEDVGNSYFNGFLLPDDDLKLLSQIKKLKLLALKAEYGYRTHTNLLIDQIFQSQNGEGIAKSEMHDEWQSFFSEIPFDTTYLNGGLLDYRHLLFIYLSEMHNYTYDFKTAAGQVDRQWPRRCNAFIKEGTYPEEIKEYLIANDLRTWMGIQGITPELDTIFSEFKRVYIGSIYMRALQERYDEQVAILPGSIAPEIKGRTLEGKLVSLTDFKGMPVYVNVWSTECHQCIKEIPYVVELERIFKYKAIFLHVSVDTDAEEWRRMLANENDWFGVHIIIDQGQVQNMDRNYKVIGYPKYFLIDQVGKIVSAKAPRPSSSRAKDEIASLVNNGARSQ